MNLYDEAAQPLAVDIALAGDLFSRRQDGLDTTEIDEDRAVRAHAGVRLDDAADDVAFLSRPLGEGGLVVGIAQTGHDHLLRRHRGDTAEVRWGVVPLTDDLQIGRASCRERKWVPPVAV